MSQQERGRIKEGFSFDCSFPNRLVYPSRVFQNIIVTFVSDKLCHGPSQRLSEGDSGNNIYTLVALKNIFDKLTSIYYRMDKLHKVSVNTKKLIERSYCLNFTQSFSWYLFTEQMKYLLLDRSSNRMFLNQIQNLDSRDRIKCFQHFIFFPCRYQMSFFLIYPPLS